MSTRETVLTDEAPAAIGPYSQAVRWGGLLICSGQLPLDPATGEIAGDDAAAQAQRCLQNLDAIARAAGARLDRAIRLTLYLTSIGDFAAVNERYAEWFTDEPPARGTVGVAELPKGARVEIDAIVPLD